MTIASLPTTADFGDAIAVVDYMETHVNCRCTMVPRAKSYAEITGDASLPDDRPPITNGPAAFAQLDPAIQQEILGPGKFALYQAGLPLEAMWKTTDNPIWGRSRVGKSIAQLRAEVNAGMWQLNEAILTP